MLAAADPGEGEKVVVGPIDVELLRAERARRFGHDMRAHLRTGVHDYHATTGLTPADAHPITGESLRARIDDAKRRTGERP